MANRTQKEEAIVLWMIEDDALFRDGVSVLINRTPGIEVREDNLFLLQEGIIAGTIQTYRRIWSICSRISWEKRRQALPMRQLEFRRCTV
jgi:hypothetical protein